MSRSDWVEVITAATLVIVAISQIADMTGLTGISLPRDAWTCTQVGREIKPSELTSLRLVVVSLSMRGGFATPRMEIASHGTIRHP